MPETTTAPEQSNARSAGVSSADEELVEESLVEAVSIDSLCGVY